MIKIFKNRKSFKKKKQKQLLLRMKTMLCNSGNSDQCFLAMALVILNYSSFCLLNNQQWFSGNQASFPPL